MRHTIRIPAGIVGLSLLLSAGSFLLPAFNGANLLQVHSRAAVASMAASLFSCAALWFLSGLKSFKADLRFAYRLLALGVILWGVALLQLPIVGLYNLWNSWWGNSGALIIPFMVASILIYAGMRKFAKLMGVKTKATSFLFVMGSIVIVMTVSAIAAHYLVIHPFEGIETFTATVGWSAAFLFFSAYLAYRIQMIIGGEYRDAMRWLKYMLLGFAFASSHEYVINFFLAFESPYLLYGFSLSPFALAGFVMVEASRRFNVLSKLSPIAETHQYKTSVLRDDDYVDSIIAVAGFASNPREIDSILDGLRAITARQNEQQLLSEQQKTRLLATYYELETYLITREPLRNFSKEQLRQRVSPAFREVLDEKAGVPIQHNTQPRQ